MLRLAHRGDWRHVPENSIRSFEAAMRVPGCDGVKLASSASTRAFARHGRSSLLHAPIASVPARTVASSSSSEATESKVPTSSLRALASFSTAAGSNPPGIAGAGPPLEQPVASARAAAVANVRRFISFLSRCLACAEGRGP